MKTTKKPIKKSKHGKWKWILVISIILLAIITVIYNSDKIIYEYPEKILSGVSKDQHIYLFVPYVQYTNKIFRIIDEMSISPFKKRIDDGALPIYELILSRNDILHFTNISKEAVKKGYMPPEINTWRNAKIHYNTKKYDIEIKLHGDMLTHWDSNIKSYKVKTSKQESINNIRRMNFILFEDRKITGKITRLISQKLGLMDIRDDVVALKINSVSQGVYYMQESIGQEFLEYNQCSSCAIIKNTDNFVEDHPRNSNKQNFKDPNGLYFGGGHYTAFNYEISNIEPEKSDLNQEKIIYQTNLLFNAVKEKDVEKVASFFDLEYLSSFEALRILIGSPHFVTGDNLVLVYKATNGKFYPVPKNEDLKSIFLEYGGIERDINLLNERYDSYVVDLFELITRNDNIRRLRNQKIYNLVMNNNLIEDIDKLVGHYLPYSTAYKTNKLSERFMKYSLKNSKKDIQHNMVTIKNNLEYAKSYFNIIYKDNTIDIEIIPDSMSYLKLSKFNLNFEYPYQGKIKMEYGNKTKILFVKNDTKNMDIIKAFKDLFYSASLDNDLHPTKRVYKIKLSFENTNLIDLNHIDIEMINDATNQIISKDDIYLQIANGNDFYEENMPYDEFTRKYSEFNWEINSNNLYLKKGNYVLNQNLIIPKDFNLIIKAGTKISLDKDISIISFGDTTISGSQDLPVIIEPINHEKPFGTFGIVGGKTNIEFLDISGGNEKFIQGIYFSGAMSIHHSDTQINNSIISSNNADDGLNIKYANILIENTKFLNNAADQFDCDFCTGIVKNNLFTYEQSKSPNLDGGDGLDFSGSKVLIINNQFQGLKDKGISIGEQTDAILFNNILSYNNISIAVKDNSHVFIIQNIFDNNNLAVNTYQKKSLFGPAYSYFWGNKYQANKKDYESDKNSVKTDLDLKPDFFNMIKNENLDAFNLLEKVQE